MKKLLLLLMVLFLMTAASAVSPAAGAPADKIGVLEGIFRPQSMLISGDRIYVAQDSIFHVFSVRDAVLLTSFCAEGEGPGELKSVPMIPATLRRVGGNLVGEGMNKIIVYSHEESRIIAEKRKGGMLWNFTPFGDGFLATRFQPRGGDRIDITLLHMDAGLQEKGVLHFQPTVDRDKEIIMLRDPICFAVLGNNLYVEKSPLGFVIDKYDLNGRRISRIEKMEFIPPLLDDAYKRALMDSLQRDPLIMSVVKGRGGWDAFRKETTFTFPDKLPVIRSIKEWGGKLYVLLHTGNFHEAELLVMQPDGEIMTRQRVPFTPSPYFTANAIGKRIDLWDVGPGGYYFLQPFGDESEWRLCRMGLSRD